MRETTALWTRCPKASEEGTTQMPRRLRNTSLTGSVWGRNVTRRHQNFGNSRKVTEAAVWRKMWRGDGGGIEVSDEPAALFQLRDEEALKYSRDGGEEAGADSGATLEEYLIGLVN